MRSVAALGMWVGALVTTLQAASCGSSGSSCGDGATIAGTVIDADSRSGINGSFVVLEKGGLAEVNPEPTQYNPAYTYAFPSNSSGQYSLDAACGPYGVYGFATGFHCAGVSESAGSSPQVVLQANDSSDLLPTISNVVFTPSPVGEGGTVNISADVASTNPNDLLSDAVLLLDLSTFQVMALAPPAASSEDGYANGTWQRSFRVPSTPGVKNYTLVAATKSCLVASVVAPLTLEY